MRKQDRAVTILLSNKRLRKKLKRHRSHKIYTGEYSVVAKLKKINCERDSRILDRHSFELHDFINQKSPSLLSLDPDEEILIPPIFSLEYQYDESFAILNQLRFCLWKSKERYIFINFSNCTSVDFSILFLLKVFLDEYISEFRKVDGKLSFYKTKPNIKIRSSKTEEVNVALVANGLIPKTNCRDTKFIPISTLDLIKGRKSQKSFLENKKGSAVTKIRSYIDYKCLGRHGVNLSSTGKSNFDGMISEILSNAEDHSPFNTWYAFGNFYESTSNSNPDVVGEINLAILNFGYSIYEGFESTKNENIETYSEMNDLFNFVYNCKETRKSFSKENLFTLYALQDGCSRLRYIEESRGTGTMKFITSFLNLGDYENKELGYVPRLMIYSGNTSLRCDNAYKPFMLDKVNYLSLNSENDLSLPPEKSHLKNLKTIFPGTLLVGKFYLNKNHLQNKIKSNVS